MLQKTSVWRGAVSEAYRTQLDSWMQENRENEDVRVEHIDLSDYDSKLIADKGIEALGLGGEFFDLFMSQKAFIFHNLQDWSAPDVKKLVTYLQKMECPLVVAFTQEKDAAAVKAISDIIDDDFDYIIPKENPGFGEWIAMYFTRNGSEISIQDAFKLAEFCGEDRDLAVSISRAVLANSLGRKVNWKEHISPVAGKMGFVAPYKITGALAKGDISGSVEILTRVLDGGMAPLAVLGMLRKRYQSYITALNFNNPQAFVKEAGGNPYAAKYLFNEAKALGGVRIAKSMQSILNTDVSLKGGATGMPPIAVMEILVIELANQFKMANRR